MNISVQGKFSIYKNPLLQICFLGGDNYLRFCGIQEK